jgi:hypothetical protein
MSNSEQLNNGVELAYALNAAMDIGKEISLPMSDDVIDKIGELADDATKMAEANVRRSGKGRSIHNSIHKPYSQIELLAIDQYFSMDPMHLKA